MGVTAGAELHQGAWGDFKGWEVHDRILICNWHEQCQGDLYLQSASEFLEHPCGSQLSRLDNVKFGQRQQNCMRP